MSRMRERAARAAARLRADSRVLPADAVCPFDLAEGLGVVVRCACAEHGGYVRAGS